MAINAKVGLLLLLAASLQADSHSIALKRVEHGKGLWTVPDRPPAYQWRVVSGAVPREGLSDCRQLGMVDAHADHSDNIVIVSCKGDVTLRLEGIDLAP